MGKDTQREKSICTQLKEALENGDYDRASDLQIEMARKVESLEDAYRVYAENIIG